MRKIKTNDNDQIGLSLSIANDLMACGSDITTKRVKLRDYQLDVVNGVSEWFNQGKTGVLTYAPTGAGKSVMSAFIMADFLRRGEKVLFVVHRIPLIEQTIKTIRNILGNDTPVTVYQGGNTIIEPEANLFIGMAQSIKLGKLPDDLKLVVFDEVHTTAYFKIVRDVRNKYHLTAKFLGLSATPWRTSSKENFCWLFDAVVRSPDVQTLIDKGQLTRPKCYGYNGIKNYTNIEETRRGEFSNKFLSIVCNQELNREIIEHYKQYCSGKQAIAFCANVKQAQDLTAQFIEAGYKASLWVGATTETERKAIQLDFRHKEIQIIVSVSCLCEGFDEPSAEVALIGRPTKSRALFFQMIGRVLRLYDGKETAYILDFGGNFERVGSPLSKYNIKLCSPPPNYNKVGGGTTKECPKCGSQIHNTMRICPYCGHILPEPEERNLIVSDFGEILTPDQLEQCKYLRSQTRRLFKKLQKHYGEGESPNHKLNPIRAKFMFWEKYGYFPPSEWYEGIIFGGENTKENRNTYYAYLKWLFPTKSDYHLKTILEYEFGLNSPKKTFTPNNPKIHEVPTPQNWRKILGISPSADYAAAKNVYRQLAQKYHPDLLQNNEDATVIMQNINLAFEYAKKQLKR